MVQHLLNPFDVISHRGQIPWLWFFCVSSTTRWATPATSTASGNQTWQREVVPTKNGAFKCFYWEKPLFQCGKLSMVSMVEGFLQSDQDAPGLERNQVGLVLKVQSPCLVPPGPSGPIGTPKNVGQVSEWLDNDGYDWLMNNILTVLWLVWLVKSLMMVGLQFYGKSSGCALPHRPGYPTRPVWKGTQWWARTNV